MTDVRFEASAAGRALQSERFHGVSTARFEISGPTREEALHARAAAGAVLRGSGEPSHLTIGPFVEGVTIE